MSILVCADCDRIFRTKDDFSNHLHFCEYNDQKDSEKVLSPPRTVRIQDTGKCDHCDAVFKFKSKKKLIRHHVEEHPNCCLCPFGCHLPRVGDGKTVITVIYDHVMEDHRDKEDTPTFRKIVNLYTLQSGVRLTCTTCNKTYHTELSLKAHVKKKHLTTAEKLPCDVCGKVFEFPWHLKDHKYKTHAKDTTCPTCGLVFNEYSLKRHIRVVHENRRNSQCDICGKVFVCEGKVKIHKIRVHLNLKPFQCDGCSFTCASISNLNIHRRKRHDKKKNLRMGDFPEIENIFKSESHIFETE